MTTTPTILVLGGTGKTGRRVAHRLTESAAVVRTAARSGADTVFDWDDTTTHDDALRDVTALYLVPPAFRLDYTDDVSSFVDRAQANGVEHVTFLSAYGMQYAPDFVPLRAVELDLIDRTGITHAIVRPAWFMQNFSESFFQPELAARRVISAPTGSGTEAFVHAQDIADVAAATLLDPTTHAGCAYDVTGPQSLSFDQVAEAIGAAVGETVTHNDIDPEEWIDQTTSAGLPGDYVQVLAGLFEQIREGRGSQPNDHVQQATGNPPRDFDTYINEPDTVVAINAGASGR